MKYDFWELEEHVGQLWDRVIKRASSTSYPDQVIYLDDIRRTLGIIFRAMGGNCASSIEASTATEHHSRRGLLKRISGKEDKVELCWQDENSLFLPYKIDVFPQQSLNKKLYIWLAALNAADDFNAGPWVKRNQQLTCRTLQAFPGLKNYYDELMNAQIAIRPDIDSLPQDLAQQERVIQAALRNPYTTKTLKIASKPPQPVYLWLHPSPPSVSSGMPGSMQDIEQTPDNRQEDDEHRKRIAKREKTSSRKDKGLLSMRYENIFSWGDFINLDRSSEDEDDLDDAKDAAKDMQTLNITQDSRPVSSALKFDLDLPSAANDDLVMSEGILLDEWDYKQRRYHRNYCCLKEMQSSGGESTELPEHLKKTARKLRSQFEAITPTRIWHRAQVDGPELDIDAYTSFVTDRLRGSAEMSASVYANLRTHHRDMACLLLADLSLSTDAWVNNDARVIDIIQDSLYLFSETLANSGDLLAIHGFSSRNRNHIRYNLIKDFKESYNSVVRSRINALKPGFYTRMGAAIRHATTQLEQQSSTQKLMMILTDGKPNDLDLYEGRYGIEDTRMALIEARKKGLQPFCVTIDKEAGDYLPYIFGEGHYIVIRKATDLPHMLPMLYARLTHG